MNEDVFNGVTFRIDDRVRLKGNSYKHYPIDLKKGDIAKIETMEGSGAYIISEKGKTYIHMNCIEKAPTINWRDRMKRL